MSITHIEDLPINDFLNALKSFHKFKATEKLDGSFLSFGFDEQGKFYTSREAKKGNRFYTSEQYGNKFWTTGFRSAHTALEKTIPILKKILNNNEQIDCEILFGPQPNAIPYDQDKNFIVILGSSNVDGQTIEDLTNSLSNLSIKIKTDKVPYTIDGETIDYQDQTHLWKVVSVQKVDQSKISGMFNNNQIFSLIQKLETYLKSSSGILNLNNAEVLGIKLNKKPEGVHKENWKHLKVELKDRREKIYNKVLSYKLGVKEILLDNLVRNLQSQFSNDSGWIEGLVLQMNNDSKPIKLVDKDIFTQINQFNHLIRKEISQDIWVPFKKEIQNLDTVDYINAKKIAINYAKKLKNLKDQYLNDYKNMSLNIEKGQFQKEFKYQGEIHKRTIESFASTFERIQNILDKIKVNPEIDSKELFLNESIMIKEGGNAFEDLVRIQKNDIPETIKYISKITGISFEELNNNLLGSAGKATTSGDIDIAIDQSKHNLEDLKTKVSRNLDEDFIRMSAGLGILHLKVPIKGDETNGFIQVDLMMTQHPEWARFNFFSAGDASKYKGAYRRRLLSAVAASGNQTEYDNNELIARIGWVWVPSMGLQWQERRRTIKKTGGYTKAFKIKRGKTITNPEEVIKILFGRNIPIENLSSAEGVLDQINKSNFSTQRKNLIKDIYRQSLESAGFKFPEELM